MRRPPALLAVVASAPVLVVGITVAQVVARPHLSPLSDTVSHLASNDESHRWVAASTFIAYGLLLLVGAWALRGIAGNGVANLVGVYGASAVVAGLLPKDPPGPHHTTASGAHVAATIVGGVAVAAVMVAIALRGGRPGQRAVAGVAAAWTVAWTIVFRLSWGSHWYGLYERLLIGGGALWLSAWAATTLRFSGDLLRSRHDGPPENGV